MNKFFNLLEWVGLRFASSAEALPRLLETIVYAAFCASLLLSFYGQVSSPFFYGEVFVLLAIAFWHIAPRPTADNFNYQAPNERSYWRLIGFAICGLVMLSFFTMPISSDGQRAKLLRMIMNAETGSVWDSSRVDALSVVYNAPTAYYLIYTPIEALHLHKAFYSLFNTLLILGSALNLFLMGKNNRTAERLLLLLLFIASPQYLFAALSEHEDALTFFLSTRAIYWLLEGPAALRLIFYAALSALLAVAVKYTTGLFLPFSAIALSWFYGRFSQWKAWLQVKTILSAIAFLIPIVLVIFIPDMLLSDAQGTTFTKRAGYISGVHAAAAASCMLPHFFLRLFEFFSDGILIFTDFFHINLSHYVPSYELIAKPCTYYDTSLQGYLKPDDISRESTQYGWLPLMAGAGIFLARGKDRRIALASIALFLLPVAIYSLTFTYWGGTGRYFMTGALALLPAFLISVSCARQKLSRRHFLALLLFLATPALCVVVKSEVGLSALPRRIIKGDYHTIQINRLPALKNITGPANIYFNDVMSTYSLLRAIPSTQVTAKKSIIPGVVNIVALPIEYSGRTNWHDSNWLIPVPANQGEFVMMGNVGPFFGNTVPSIFFKSYQPGDEDARFSLKFVSPKEAPDKWVKGSHKLTTQPVRYFLSQNDSGNGLCVEWEKEKTLWAITPYDNCLHSSEVMKYGF